MKRTEMIEKIIEVLREVADAPNDVKAKSILAMQMEAGMSPPWYLKKDSTPVQEGYYPEGQPIPEWEKE